MNNFKNFLLTLTQQEVKQALKYGHDLYNLKPYDIDNIDIEGAEKTYESIN